MVEWAAPALRILSLLPRDAYSVWQAEVKDAGGQLIFFPTIEIKPCVLSASSLAAGENQLEQAEWIIITSKHALYSLPPVWKPILAEGKLKLACLGPATAQACEVQGMSPALVLPLGSTSETLLAHPKFAPKEINEKRVVLLSGQGGRTFIQSTLVTRGAKVFKWALYQRQCPAVARLTLQQLHAWGINALAVTSREALANLEKLSEPNVMNHIKQMPVFTISERLQADLEAQGFTCVKKMAQ